MCEESNKIIFCSCQDKTDNPNTDEIYTWELYKYIPSPRSMPNNLTREPKTIKGSFRRHNHDLLSTDEFLNINNILKEMNLRNCFDFDYIPQERDCLFIGIDFGKIKVVFRKGKWVETINESFIVGVSEKIAAGGISNSYLNTYRLRPTIYDEHKLRQLMLDYQKKAKSFFSDDKTLRGMALDIYFLVKRFDIECDFPIRKKTNHLKLANYYIQDILPRISPELNNLDFPLYPDFHEGNLNSVKFFYFWFFCGWCIIILISMYIL